jgi:hypothetical protein
VDEEIIELVAPDTRIAVLRSDVDPDEDDWTANEDGCGCTNTLWCGAPSHDPHRWDQFRTVRIKARKAYKAGRAHHHFCGYDRAYNTGHCGPRAWTCNDPGCYGLESFPWCRQCPQCVSDGQALAALSRMGQ